MSPDLAADPRSAALEARFQLLNMELEPEDLTRYFGAEFLRTAVSAARNLNQWLGEAEEALGELATSEETRRLVEGLQLVVAAGSRGQEAAPGGLEESFYGMDDLLADEVAVFFEHQKLYRALTQSTMNMMGGTGAGAFREALDLMRYGFSEMGVERNEALREAKNLLNGLVCDTQMSGGGLAYFAYGFLSWKLGRNGVDAERYASEAILMLARSGGLGPHLAARFLSNVHFAGDDAQRGYEAIRKAVGFFPERAALAEAAVLATRLGRVTEAASFVEQGAADSFLHPLRLLADPELAPICPELLSAAIDAQSRARKEAGSHLAVWNQEIHKIRGAQKRAGIIIELPGMLDTGRKEMGSQLAQADLIGACLLGQGALSSASEARRIAMFELKREHEKGLAAYGAAKHRVDHAWVVRDLLVQNATAEEQAAVAAAREALNRSLGEAEKAQGGCALSAGIGCGAFVAYLLLAAVLATQGIAGGPGSLLGMFGLAAASVPILFGISALISAGMRRAGLEAELREKMRRAQSAEDAATRQADKVYNESIAQYREELLEAEAHVQRLDDALQMLRDVPMAA